MAIRRRPIDGSTSRCDRCGNAAEWRNRVISSCCMLGESLCDSCESKSTHTRWWNRDDTFWSDVADDAAWLIGKASNKLKKLNKQNSPSDLNPNIGWAGTTGEETL